MAGLNSDVTPVRRPPFVLPEKNRIKIQALVDPIFLSEDDIRKTMSVFQQEMLLASSSSKKSRDKSSVWMTNTFVPGLLDGTEEGHFLGLDLGGTNFRVLLCSLKGGKCETISKNYNLSSHKFHGPCAELFDHLAESIADFLEENKLKERHLTLGFTFSFPMSQHALNKAVLLTWTKSIACPDGKGEDVVRMLEEAIARRGDLKVKVSAILSDTTGTLLSGSQVDHECVIGTVLGTGSNSAYIEKNANIEKFTDGETSSSQEVVVNIEWGSFGDNGCLAFFKTEYDAEIDGHSNHPGSFTFEKLFAGHDVGDLARLALLKLVQEGLACSGHVTDKLKTWRTIAPKHISHVEKDGPDVTTHAAQFLETLDLPYSHEDAMIVKYICNAVSLRTAHLNSACLAVVLQRLKRKSCTIAFDGSLYRHHPKHLNLVSGWLKHLVPDCQVRFIDAQDGSGRGAAFLAAVVARVEQHTAK